MDFSLNDDHLALRSAIRRFVDSSNDITELGKLGVFGLTIPEDFGGSNLSAVERMLVATELGRGLLATRWQSTAVQAGTLIQTAMPAFSEAPQLLRQIANGQDVAALCSAGTNAKLTNNTFSGECRYVVMNRPRDWYFVFLAEPACWLMISVQASGITNKTLTLLDGTQASHLTFFNTAVHRIIAHGDTALALSDTVRCHSDASMCAEALGAMEKLLDLTKDHLNTRQQFGAPLAKFQALQHQIADQIVRYELFASLVALAAMAVAESNQAERYTRAATAYLAQHCKPFCETLIQMHGAMGVTDENFVGKLVKRLLVIAHWHGDAQTLREQYQQVSTPK